MSKFNIGDRVVQKRQVKVSNIPMEVGTVVAYVAVDNSPIIQWCDEPSYMQNIKDNDLLSEDDALVEKQRLMAEKKSLEAQFADTRQAILAKLETATSLVQEAVDLTTKYGKKFSEFDQEVRPMLRNLVRTGWSPSSIGCA